MKSFQHASMYGFAACIVAIVISLGLHFTGQYQSLLNYLSYVGYIVFAVLAIKAWRATNYGGFITYGKALGHSTYVALMFSVIMGVWAYVFFEFIAHDEIMKMQSVEMAKQATIMKEKYGFTDAQLKEQFEIAKKFTSGPVIAIFALVGNMFMLTIVNLIIAAIMKKDDPSKNTFEQSSAV